MIFILDITKFESRINEYLEDLRQEEKTNSTIKRYETNFRKMVEFFKSNNLLNVDKSNLILFKDFLIENYKTSTANLFIVSINKYLSWLSYDNLKLKPIKVQTRINLDDIMSKSEYTRLLQYAQKLNKNKMYYLMKTLAGTGIRISELKYITVEAIKKGDVEVKNKGKQRYIFINADLSKELKKYCEENNIETGMIFHGRDNNKLIDQSYIWRELKYIAGQAKVNKSKIHAHSFRHLFAKTYMATIGNITELAEILGHSSLETTRIYTRTSKKDKLDNILKLGL